MPQRPNSFQQDLCALVVTQGVCHGGTISSLHGNMLLMGKSGGNLILISKIKVTFVRQGASCTAMSRPGRGESTRACSIISNLLADDEQDHIVNRIHQKQLAGQTTKRRAENLIAATERGSIEMQTRYCSGGPCIVSSLLTLSSSDPESR